jgi:hypothetical protein
MRFAKPILIMVMGVALGAYAFDCVPMNTLEQSMQCCDSMDCAAHGHHHQDCCQTASSLHTPFVQAASVHGPVFAPVVLAMLPVTAEPSIFQSATFLIHWNSHGPPGSDLPAQHPLRI